jgi:hypothetical protein
MTDERTESTSIPYPVKKYDGGMAYCVCCRGTFSADKTIFGVSPYFPLVPPDHFCKECAKALDVTGYEWPTPRTASHPCG